MKKKQQNKFVLNYKYRIYPTKQQIELLDDTLSVCKGVYNIILEYRIDCYKNNIKVGKFGCNTFITNLKKKEEYSWINKVHSQVLQNVSTRVECAYQRFFNKLGGFPKTKSKNRYNSFTYPQSGYKILDRNHIKVSKIGKIKIKMERDIVGTIKNLTITKNCCNQWFAVFTVEQTREQFIKTPKTTGNVVGIDVGIKNFLTLSDGTVFENKHFLKKKLKHLKKLQSKASKKKLGSNNRKKANAKVAKVHLHIANQRSNYIYQVANFLVNHYQVIGLEELRPKFMIKNHKLAQSACDVSIYQFQQTLKYESIKYNTIVGFSNPKYTSQNCCICGHTKSDLKLSDRTYICPECGQIIDRDLNAAINILNQIPEQFRFDLKNNNISMVGMTKSLVTNPLKPVEMMTSGISNTDIKSMSVNQETVCFS